MAMEDLYKKIFFLIERQRFSEAENMLAKGLSEEPGDTELLYLSAYVDFAQELEETAEKTLHDLLQLDPDHESGRHLLAILYLDQNRLLESEERILGLLRDYPSDPDYYSTYARIMLHAYKLDKAERLASEALRLNPEHAEALTLTVVFSVIRDDQTSAKDSLAELMRLHPESSRAVWAVLSVLEDRGDDKESLRLAQEVLRSDPTNENLVELIRELRIRTHPTMLPLWPMRKWGWSASAAMWIGFLLVYSVAMKISDEAAFWIVILWLGYAVYSWIYPPILKRILS